MFKVNFVAFHTSQFIPGLGTIGDSLPSQTKTYRLDMKADSSWLYLDIGYGGINECVAVPIASVKIVKYEKLSKTDSIAQDTKKSA